ncbi:OmpA/MotB family protein [Dyella telluris]|uniref:OmpA family protein n=1 Tax=Dyella telluris TaxID=2763498 RepID=A0A7G8PYZ0_9GAMM|nr:OmpA family protein [Dyella telluris]QNJ99747.1 OmpA family protein [Dyella telluris]
MKVIRMAMLACAVAAAVGCVSESKYKKEVAQANQYQAEDAQLTAINQQLSAKLGKDDATIKQLKGELRVTVVNDVLFAEGGVALDARGQEALDKMAPTLSTLSKQRVAVEAFTDNVPIGPALKARFPSNVELSSARADEVVRYLARKGVPDRLMSAQGFGERHPIASNDTPDGRAQNRRVEIVITNAPLQ